MGTPDTRPFPMQDGPPIPWFLAAIIYEHLYRFRSQTLAELAARGGFGWDEVSSLWSDKRRSWGTTPEHREAVRTEVNYALTELTVALASLPPSSTEGVGDA